MKRLLFIPIFFICLQALATDYYVKSTGSNTNSGLSDALAWQTIQKVNTSWTAGTFNPGDRILFRRGDTFYGTIIVTESGTAGNPITIGAYGTGKAPVISAFTTVVNMANEGGGIYSRTITTESTPNIVTVDGINTRRGKYPDTGWLTIDSHNGGSSITDAALPLSPDWTGAEAVVRKNAWILDRCFINDHIDHTLYINNPSGYPWPNYSIAGHGYFVQNDVRTLTSYGEWYYGGGKFYIYLGPVDPAGVTIKLSTLSRNITIQGRDYIRISGVTLEGANESAIYISSSDYVTVQECRIQYCGDAGIDGAHSGGGSSYGFVALNDTIADIQNQGIILGSEFNGALISGNVVTRVGLLPGHNFSGDGQNNGIKLYGSAHIIEYNRVTDVGYNGIDFGGHNVKVRYNYVDGFGSVKDDVGGIYTTCFGTLWKAREIYGNIVLNGVGAPEWPGETETSTTGIYADQREANLAIYGNTVYNVHQGIFLHNAHECQVYDNLVYACHESQLYAVDDSSWPDDHLRNLEINNNQWLALGPPSAAKNQYAMWFQSYRDVNENYLFGEADYNVACRFFQETGTLYNIVRVTGVSWAGTNLTYAQWKTNSGQDQHSTGNLGGTVTNTDQLHFIYNDTRVNKTYTLSATMKNPRGVTYLAGTITLQPFTSRLLIGTGTVTDAETSGNLPSVRSTSSSTTETTITVAGEVTDDGGSSITDRGICWATAINPTLANNVIHAGIGLGSFQVTITNLTPATTYYVRVFATNNTGTGYSSNITARTNGGVPYLMKHLNQFVIEGSHDVVQGNALIIHEE